MMSLDAEIEGVNLSGRASGKSYRTVRLSVLAAVLGETVEVRTRTDDDADRVAHAIRRELDVLPRAATHGLDGKIIVVSASGAEVRP